MSRAARSWSIFAGGTRTALVYALSCRSTIRAYGLHRNLSFPHFTTDSNVSVASARDGAIWQPDRPNESITVHCHAYLRIAGWNVERVTRNEKSRTNSSQFMRHTVDYQLNSHLGGKMIAHGVLSMGIHGHKVDSKERTLRHSLPGNVCRRVQMLMKSLDPDLTNESRQGQAKSYRRSPEYFKRFRDREKHLWRMFARMSAKLVEIGW